MVTNSAYNGTSAYNQAQMTTTTYKTKKGKMTFSDIQATTDMFQLQDQFANYLKENGKDGKHVPDAEVDWFTFGTATAAVQGTKAVVKEGLKIVAKDVFTGWSLNLGSQTLAKMDLPPEFAFMAHVGLNIAISRSNIKKARELVELKRLFPQLKQKNMHLTQLREVTKQMMWYLENSKKVHLQVMMLLQRIWMHNILILIIGMN